LLFGGALLLGLGFAAIEPENFDFVRFGSAPVNVAMFALLFIAFGAAIAYLFDAIRGLVERGGAASVAVEVVAWLAALATLGLFVLAIFSVGGIGDLGTTIPVAIGVLVPPVVLWRGLPRSLGYAAFSLPLVVGGIKTLSGVVQIVD
jgi:hypothetical protein